MNNNVVMTRQEFNQLKENLELLERDMEQYTTYTNQLKAFTLALLRLQFDVGVCDDDVELLGLQHGILERKIFNKPCVEPSLVDDGWVGGCTCSQYYTQEEWEEGVQCNRIVEWLLDENS